MPLEMRKRARESALKHLEKFYKVPRVGMNIALIQGERKVYVPPRRSRVPKVSVLQEFIDTKRKEGKVQISGEMGEDPALLRSRKPNQPQVSSLSEIIGDIEDWKERQVRPSRKIFTENRERVTRFPKSEMKSGPFGEMTDAERLKRQKIEDQRLRAMREWIDIQLEGEESFTLEFDEKHKPIVTHVPRDVMTAEGEPARATAPVTLPRVNSFSLPSIGEKPQSRSNSKEPGAR